MSHLTWLFLLRGNRSMRNIQELLLDIRGEEQAALFREIAVKRLNEACMRSCRLGFDEDGTDFSFRIAGLAEDALHRFVAACAQGAEQKAGGPAGA